MALLTWLVNGLRWLVALILPFFAKARDFRGIGPALRWALHIFLVVAILVGLFFLNKLPFFQRNLLAPSLVEQWWLVSLFLLVYLISWLGWWLWRLLQTDDGPGFPDIDAAWDEAVAAANQQGIDITEAPLFLVLGRAAGGEDALLQSAQVPLTVQGAPARPDAPVHLYGNRDAFFVTCAGASLTGRQAAILAEDGPADYGASEPGTGDSVAAGGGNDADKSIGMFSMGMPNGMQEVRALFLQAQREGRALTEAEKQRMDQLMGKTGAARPKRARPQLLRNMEESARISARLEYLCRLIVRDRRPYCSINGVLALVPYAATDCDEDATQTGDIFRRDLDTVRRGAQVDCPLFALFADLERVPGFTEFIECFPKDQRQRRIGQHFPLVPDLDPAKISRAIEGSARWICTALLPTLIYKFLRLESSGRETSADAVQANYRLIQLMSQLRDREKRLGLILTRANESPEQAPTYFGGCYLGASGRDATREQAFVSGVFRRLIENQSYVSWTEHVLADEEHSRRWTLYGYVALGGFVAMVAAVVAFVWWK
ncbi:MAG TPA: type VI secretion protein IcmF/TssM N-terminal domain-containing protein [Gemmataceae bacterium]